MLVEPKKGTAVRNSRRGSDQWGECSSILRQSLALSAMRQPVRASVLRGVPRPRRRPRVFRCVSHGSRSELGMKSFSHQKRQHGFVQFKFVAARGEKLNFARQKLFGNLQLVFVAQAVEHELFIDARKNFRDAGLAVRGTERAVPSVASLECCRLINSAEPMLEVSQT